jgi:NOL1/NOP2/sun family putative RNA methylase
MGSVGDVKRKLPDDFIDGLYSSFSSNIADKMLQGMASNRCTTLRVNSIRYNIHDLLNYFKSINIKFERIPWCKDGLVIKNTKEKEIEGLDIYNKGYIYLQSISSMLPPVILNPLKGENVLDLTAAPGSKTTQIAALMNNEGYILANEIDKIRSERLTYNIKKLGVTIADVKVGKGEKIGDIYPEFFDKVLLDAPCSGEGRFIIYDAKTYKYWSKKEIQRLANTQKKLFESGYKSLKKGGTMVYSTCTLNLKENEEIIDWAINNLKIQILPLNVNMSGILPAYNINNKNNIINAIRILPSKDMEGFFICKIRKL